jgi:hypothetical protein
LAEKKNWISRLKEFAKRYWLEKRNQRTININNINNIIFKGTASRVSTDTNFFVCHGRKIKIKHNNRGGRPNVAEISWKKPFWRQK